MHLETKAIWCEASFKEVRHISRSQYDYPLKKKSFHSWNVISEKHYKVSFRGNKMRTNRKGPLVCFNMAFDFKKTQRKKNARIPLDLHRKTKTKAFKLLSFLLSTVANPKKLNTPFLFTLFFCLSV